MKLELPLKNEEISCTDSITSALRSLSPLTRRLVTEAEKLLQLVLSLPISVAEAERSFSCLRRLKTWVRATMSQQRLTHLALAHVHKDILDSLDMDALKRDFVNKTPERKSVFGKL